MTLSPQSADLRERLLAMIGRGAGGAVADDAFTSVAVDVFAHQFARNPIYRRFCEARGTTPDTVNRWIDIPAVPTDAFKAAPLVCGDPAEAAVAFRTSGTTGGTAHRGIHYLLDTRLYRAALLEGFRFHLLPDREKLRVLSLVPPWADSPDSSLSFMVEEVVRTLGTPGSGFFVSNDGVRMDDLLRSLAEAADTIEPVLLVGTSLAFLHVLETLERRALAFRLPFGSRIMDTGGFKGRAREVNRSELYGLLSRRCDVDPDFIVNEYGMTEMSSQFYDGVAGAARPIELPRLHRPPPWVRSVAVDPESLEPLADGDVGLLRHVDLANLDSVAALQTADLGQIVGGAIELQGRAPGATARGCSIAMDELLQVIGTSG